MCHRLNSTAEALSVALAIPKQQALAMLAADQNLLDIPALRIRQQLEALSSLLQVPFDLLAQLAVGCPYLLRVDGPAVKIRCVWLLVVVTARPWGYSMCPECFAAEVLAVQK